MLHLIFIGQGALSLQVIWLNRIDNRNIRQKMMGSNRQQILALSSRDLREHKIIEVYTN